MTWEEYQKMVYSLELNNREETNIECPQCGKRLYRRTDVVLASYPPQYRYECDNCGWSGTGV